jgi:hypothetical protein
MLEITHILLLSVAVTLLIEKAHIVLLIVPDAAIKVMDDAVAARDKTASALIGLMTSSSPGYDEAYLSANPYATAPIAELIGRGIEPVLQAIEATEVEWAVGQKIARLSGMTDAISLKLHMSLIGTKTIADCLRATPEWATACQLVSAIDNVAATEGTSDARCLKLMQCSIVAAASPRISAISQEMPTEARENLVANWSRPSQGPGDTATDDRTTTDPDRPSRTLGADTPPREILKRTVSL